jgi:hypothetical protein
MRINTVSNVINFSTLLSRYATFRFWHFPCTRNAPGAWMTNYFGKPTKTRRELPKPKGESAGSETYSVPGSSHASIASGLKAVMRQRATGAKEFCKSVLATT